MNGLKEIETKKILIIFSLDVDTNNRLLIALKNNLQASLNNKKSQTDKEKENLTIGLFGNADISFGSFDKTSFEKAKQIRTRGLTSFYFWC